MRTREDVPSHTLGIDLASQPVDTAACLIDWSTRPATAERVEASLTDDVLVDLICEPRIAKAGIDAPFGWPLAYIDALVTYRDTGNWLPLPHKEIRFRATERVVSNETGQEPMSAATSNLAWPTIRCARILSLVANRVGEVDRSGVGRVAEVYPAAALRRWEVIPPGTTVAEASYKDDEPVRRDRRQRMMETLREKLDGVVKLPDQLVEDFADDDDDLDALVSALVARAIQLGQVDPIPSGSAWVAIREGWIHVPANGSLQRLATG